MAKENKIRKCPENFQEVQQFSDHLEIRTNHGKPKHNTSQDRIDGYRIENKNEKEMHIEENAKSVKTGYKSMKDFKCELCDKSFGKNKILKRHVQTVHEDVKPGYVTLQLHCYNSRLYNSRLNNSKTLQPQDFTTPRLFNPNTLQPQIFTTPDLTTPRLYSPGTFKLQDFTTPDFATPAFMTSDLKKNCFLN